MDDVTETSISGEAPQPETKHLAPEEVLEKLDSLSGEDKMRLRLIEQRRLGGTDFKEGELYQEAVCQAIVGERNCPRDESFVAFLAQSMRSIASHRRARPEETGADVKRPMVRKHRRSCRLRRINPIRKPPLSSRKPRTR